MLACSYVIIDSDSTEYTHWIAVDTVDCECSCSFDMFIVLSAFKYFFPFLGLGRDGGTTDWSSS